MKEIEKLGERKCARNLQNFLFSALYYPTQAHVWSFTNISIMHGCTLLSTWYVSIQKCGQSHAALLTGCGCVITRCQIKPRGKNIYSVKRGWMSKNFFSPTCCTSGFFNFKWTLHLMFILTETWNFRRNRQKISAFFYQINALFCSDVPA